MATFDEDEDWALSVAVQETKHLMSNSHQIHPESFSPKDNISSLRDKRNDSADILQLQSVQNALYDCLSPKTKDNDIPLGNSKSSGSAEAKSIVSPIPSSSSLVPPAPIRLNSTSSSSSSCSSISLPSGPHPVQGLLDYVRNHHLPYPSYAYDVSAPHLGVRVSVSCGSIQFTSSKVKYGFSKGCESQYYRR